MLTVIFFNQKWKCDIVQDDGAFRNKMFLRVVLCEFFLPGND